MKPTFILPLWASPSVMHLIVSSYTSPSENNVYSERINPFNVYFDENEAAYGRKCAFFQTVAVL